MEHPAGMGHVNGRGHDGQEFRRLPRGQRSGGQPPGKRRALNEPHAEEWMASAFAHLKQRHDVGVIEPGGGLGLGAKPGQIGGGRQIPPQEHFHRHDPAQALLPSAIDHAHAAATEFLEQFIVAEGCRERGRPRNEPIGRQRVWGRIRQRRCGEFLGRQRLEDRRLLGDRIGHRHRREQFPQLPGELGMGSRMPLEENHGRPAPRLGKLVEQNGEQLLVGRRERLGHGRRTGSGHVKS